MNRIKDLFKRKNKNILSVYFTSGFPELSSSMEILKQLEESSVDMVELGMPFSDPLADGPVIQHSSEVALQNGMNMDLLFEQTTELRKHISIPVILMGYFNPLLQYGIEKFLQRAAENGFDGLIIPDLPIREYELHYKQLFEKYNLKNIFLITPNTTEERIRKIDVLSNGFIYLVSTAGTTGARDSFSVEQQSYFKRIASYKLNNPLLAGFGISNSKTFEQACLHTNGAIIGSAFIKALQTGEYKSQIEKFIGSIKLKETQKN
ncbi:MAG TPA: tryptophan synthase subunit alpha [Bacteroidia bacterium]|jgi:tryptophan synthase alpha chain|nr:tryptophan synthase subunit alpha [Bacteroidia bacterium]